MKKAAYYLVSLFNSIGLAQNERIFFLETAVFDKSDVDLGILNYGTRGKSSVIELLVSKLL